MRITGKSALLFLLLAALLILFLFFIPACKKEAEKNYVIGFVNPNPGEKEGAHGFLRNMPKFGFIEGQNLTYIKHESKKNIDDAIQNMVDKKVDLIFTMTTPATQKAKKLTEGTGIPVVFVLYNARRAGVVESLIKPGGNLTGVQLRGSTPKSLEWLKAIAPDTKNIFVPISFDTGAARQSLADLQESAANVNLNVTVSEVSTRDELHASLSSMPEDAGAIFMLHTWLVGSNLDIVIDGAIKRKIPVVSAGHVDFEGGLVMSYSPRDDRIGWQAARLAKSILQGTPPSELPVETADFSLGINLKTARAIGLEISSDILQQADLIVR